MANELQTKLDEILLDKNTNLLPEHLKAGVTCLGVKGNFEGNGGTSSDIPVKLFETVEEMQADTEPKEGDLAIVYRDETANTKSNSKFSSATFPSTVILPEAMTDYINVRYRATDSSVQFQGYGQLDSSMFYLDCYTSTNSITIQYESSDGITYTRIDGGEETVDFGTEIRCYNSSYWNDAIGYFVQTGGKYFDGLFEYKPYTTSDLVTLRVLNTVETYQTIKLPDISKYVKDTSANTAIFVKNVIAPEKYEYKTSYLVPSEYYIVTTSQLMRIVRNGSGDYKLGINTSSPSATNYYRIIHIVDNTVESDTERLVTDASDWSAIASNSSYNWNSTTSATLPDINDCFFAIYTLANGYNHLKVIETESSFPTDVMNGSTYYGEGPLNDTKYHIASTQLTLGVSGELLPGVIGYGKNGVIVGDNSVYNSISVSKLIENTTSDIKHKDYMTVYTDKDVTSLSIIDKDKLDLSNAIMTKRYYPAQEFYDFPDTYYFNQRMTEHYYVEMGLVNSVLKVRVWDLDFNLLLSKDLSGDYIFGSSDLITAEDSTGTRIAYASAPFVSADSKAYIVSGWIDLNTQEITYKKVANASGNGLVLTVDKDDNYYVLSSATNYYSVGSNIVINGEKWLQISTSSYCYGNTPTIGVADGYLYISSADTNYKFDIYSLADKKLMTKVDAYLSNRFIQDDEGNYYMFGRLTSESPITALYRLANGGFEETEYVFSTYTTGTSKALKVAFLNDKGYILSNDLKCYCSDGTIYNVALESTSGKFINNSGALTNNGKTLRFVDKVDNGAMVRQLHLDKGFGENNSIKLIIDNDGSTDTAKDYLVINSKLPSYNGTISPAEYEEINTMAEDVLGGVE